MAELCPRMRVRLHDLVSRKDLNGQLGRLGRLAEGRWRVKLDTGEEVNVKADNISEAPESTSTVRRPAVTDVGTPSPQRRARRPVDQNVTFRPRMRVKIRGLGQRKDLNGCEGRLRGLLPEGRWQVVLDSGEEINVLAKHMMKAGWSISQCQDDLNLELREKDTDNVEDPSSELEEEEEKDDATVVRRPAAARRTLAPSVIAVPDAVDDADTVGPEEVRLPVTEVSKVLRRPASATSSPSVSTAPPISKSKTKASASTRGRPGVKKRG